MFFKKKKKAKEEKAQAPAEKKLPPIKAMYVLAFTQPKLDNANLQAAVKSAENLLKEKQPDFKRILETQMAPQSMVHIANVEYVPLMHSNDSMVTSLQGWLKNQFDEVFYPVQNINFFTQSLRDGQGKDHMVLFYFVVSQ